MALTGTKIGQELYAFFKQGIERSEICHSGRVVEYGEKAPAYKLGIGNIYDMHSANLRQTGFADKFVLNSEPDTGLVTHINTTFGTPENIRAYADFYNRHIKNGGNKTSLESLIYSLKVMLGN